MPRRGRSRKSPMVKGQTRMDAALDAMKSYGFSEELVSGTVKELLDVYGLDGWPFIEESYYKVLLETLLEKAENDTGEKVDPPTAGALQGSEDSGGDYSKASVSGHSSSASAPVCSNEQAVAIKLQPNVASDNAPQNVQPPLTTEPTDGSEASACLTQCGDTSQDSKNKELNNAKEIEDCGKKLDSATPCFNPKKDQLPTQRRRPCYGWIGSSDDESEIIELTSAPLPDALTELISARNVPKVRKRKWDVKPEDA